MTMHNPMTKSPKHHWLLCLSLSVTLSVFHTANSAEKTTVQASKSPATVGKAAAKSVKAKPAAVKTYTIIGDTNSAPLTENSRSVPAKAMMPQFAARRFGSGQFGPGGRPWNPAMRFGAGPGAARAVAGRAPTRPGSH